MTDTPRVPGAYTKLYFNGSFLGVFGTGQHTAFLMYFVTERVVSLGHSFNRLCIQIKCTDNSIYTISP